MTTSSLGDVLLAANHKAQRRQRQLLCTLTAVGSALVCCGLALCYLFYNSTTALFYIGGILCAFGSYTMLLIVQPTFRKAVRVVCLILVLILIPVCLISLSTFGNECGGFVSGFNTPASCTAGLIINYGDFILYSCSCLALLASMRIEKHSGVWRFVLSPRANLNRMWTVGLILFGSQGLMQLVARSVQASESNDRSEGLVVGGFAYSASFVLCGVLCTSSVRNRIQACLRGAGGSAAQETSAAAGISALLGGVDANEALKLGLRTFRGLPANALTQQDLAASTASPELHMKTRQASVGEVDFFVSHSWSDDSDAKWRALNRVLQEERARDVMLWLDKACLE